GPLTHWGLGSPAASSRRPLILVEANLGGLLLHVRRIGIHARGIRRGVHGGVLRIESLLNERALLLLLVCRCCAIDVGWLTHGALPHVSPGDRSPSPPGPRSAMTGSCPCVSGWTSGTGNPSARCASPGRSSSRPSHST